MMLQHLTKMKLVNLHLVSSSPSSVAAAVAAQKTTLTSSSSNHHFLVRIYLFSTETTQNPPPKPPYMVEYLISSCGFSLDKAIKASKRLAHIKSPSNPDSVIQFLKQSGLSDAQITNLISKCPTVLCARVKETLEPKIRALKEIGFSETELVQLISEIPNAFQARDLQPKIALWKSLFGTNENILKATRRNTNLLTSSLGKTIMPNLSLLRECGIPDDRVAKMILSFPMFITRNPNSVNDIVKRAEELGVPRGSGVFWQVLRSIFCISRTTFNSKFELLKSLGWSETEIVSAIRKSPVLFLLSQKKIQDTTDFFMNDVRCELSYIVRRPVLLSYSLERRLMPRHSVLRILKQKELPGGHNDFYSAVMLNENKFVDKFILRHKEKLPGLNEAYVAACAGKVPI